MSWSTVAGCDKCIARHICLDRLSAALISMKCSLKVCLTFLCSFKCICNKVTIFLGFACASM